MTYGIGLVLDRAVSSRGAMKLRSGSGADANRNPTRSGREETESS